MAEPLDSVPNGSDVLLDANVLIYGLTAKSTQCKTLLERCSREEVTGITLYEVLHEATHRFMIGSDQERKHVCAKHAASSSKHRVTSCFYGKHVSRWGIPQSPALGGVAKVRKRSSMTKDERHHLRTQRFYDLIAAGQSRIQAIRAAGFPKRNIASYHSLAYRLLKARSADVPAPPALPIERRPRCRKCGADSCDCPPAFWSKVVVLAPPAIPRPARER